MEIQLKDITLNEEMSDKTTAFYATLVINGINAGFTGNGGCGEKTFYRSMNYAGQRLISDAERFCASLPPKVYPPADPKGRPLIVKMTLQVLIDGLLYNHLVQHDLTVFKIEVEKEMMNGIVFGIPDKEYQVMKYTTSLDILCRHQQGREAIKRDIHSKVLPQLQGARVILNTNITETVKAFFDLPIGSWVVEGLASEVNG